MLNNCWTSTIRCPLCINGTACSRKNILYQLCSTRSGIKPAFESMSRIRRSRRQSNFRISGEVLMLINRTGLILRVESNQIICVNKLAYLASHAAISCSITGRSGSLQGYRAKLANSESTCCLYYINNSIIKRAIGYCTTGICGCCNSITCLTNLELNRLCVPSENNRRTSLYHRQLHVTDPHTFLTRATETELMYFRATKRLIAIITSGICTCQCSPIATISRVFASSVLDLS